VAHLRRYDGLEKRCVREILSYFVDVVGVMKPYLYGHDCHGDGLFLAHDDRNSYFEGISDTYFKDTLLLVDPDNGLEIGHSNEQHLLYQDVCNLSNRLERKSVLMVYQHFPLKYPPKPWKTKGKLEYLRMRKAKLAENISGGRVRYISDGEITFFLLSHEVEVDSKLGEVTDRYKKRYSLLYDN